VKRNVYAVVCEAAKGKTELVDYDRQREGGPRLTLSVLDIEPQ